MSKQLITGLCIIGACVAIAAGGAFGVYSYREQVKAEEAAKQKQMAEYKANVAKVTDLMERTMSTLERMDYLQSAVWHDAIYEKYSSTTAPFTHQKDYSMLGYHYVDFDTALSRLHAHEEFQNAHETLTSLGDDFKSMLSGLRNPPAGCEGEHTALVELYTAYTAYADIVLNLEGSYTTYTTNANAAKQELKKQFSIMETYITTTEEED